MPPLSNGPELLPSASDKAKLLPKSFFKNSNLDDSGISLPALRSRTDLKLHNLFLSPKLVQKVMTDLDFSKPFGPDCYSVLGLKNSDLNFGKY